MDLLPLASRATGVNPFLAILAILLILAAAIAIGFAFCVIFGLTYGFATSPKVSIDPKRRAAANAARDGFLESWHRENRRRSR